MPRLLIERTQGAQRAIELKPGVNRLGRHADNDHLLEDPSIAEFHCEINVAADRVAVKALDPAQGTFIEGQPVIEATLSPGQKLRLGAVDMILDDTPRPQVPLPLMGAPATPLARGVRPSPPKTSLGALLADQTIPVSKARSCRQHPGVPVTFVCQKCLHRCCPACVKELRVGVRSFHSCPVCSGICVPLDTNTQVAAPPASSFGSLAAGAFGYPLRGKGLALLLTWTLLFSLLEWGYFKVKWPLPIRAGTLWVILVPILGYLFAYLRNIALNTAQGADANPGWPDFIHVWDDIGLPFLHCACLVVVCVGPGVAAAYWIHLQSGLALLLLGLFFVPMALLTVSLADGLRGLNPALLISAIAKAPGAYLLAGFVFLALVALAAALQYGGAFVKLPLLSSLPVYFAALYGLVWVTRVMGLFFRQYRDRLND